jgi:hypothetical protein
VLQKSNTGFRQMNDKKKNMFSNPNFDKPLSKENAKLRYDKLTHEDKPEPKEKFEDLIERKIKKAMAEGEFDNLTGKGKPLDLKKYYDMPEHLRTAYQIIKNSGYVPEEVRLKKEMELLKEKIKDCRSEKDKHKLMKELADISQQFNFHMEYNKKLKKL